MDTNPYLRAVRLGKHLKSILSIHQNVAQSAKKDDLSHRSKTLVKGACSVGLVQYQLVSSTLLYKCRWMKCYGKSVQFINYCYYWTKIGLPETHKSSAAAFGSHFLKCKNPNFLLVKSICSRTQKSESCGYEISASLLEFCNRNSNIRHWSCNQGPLKIDWKCFAKKLTIEFFNAQPYVRPSIGKQNRCGFSRG